jgi:hypothetical protein
MQVVWGLPAAREGIVEAGVHIFDFGRGFSKNCKALLAAKLNHMRLDGQMDKSFGPALAPGAISAFHKITEGQWGVPGPEFHRATTGKWMGRAHSFSVGS